MSSALLHSPKSSSSSSSALLFVLFFRFIGNLLVGDYPEISYTEKLTRSMRGTPQGAVISPLLANVYLHEFDLQIDRYGYRMVRYADDFVILCDTQEQAQSALEHVQAWMHAHGLQLHPHKTRIGDCRVPGEGFDFLGYR